MRCPACQAEAATGAAACARCGAPLPGVPTIDGAESNASRSLHQRTQCSPRAAFNSGTPSIRQIRSGTVIFLLIAGGFLYGQFFSQGLPLWDDDYNWFSRMGSRGALALMGSILSPVSAEAGNWGFLDRPLQLLVYRLCYSLGGYEGWIYYLWKSFSLGILAAMVYMWCRTLRASRIASAAATLFFLATPSVMAAFIWHADFAPTAEALLGFILLGSCRLMEASIPEKKGPLPALVPGSLVWWGGWSGLAFAAYVGYKAKGDLKMIPVILMAVLLLARPPKWRLYLPIVGVMVLLAVPWESGILSRLPPWFPGSGGSSVGWMYTEAAFPNIQDFLWDSATLAGFRRSLYMLTWSYSGVLGWPLLTLLALMILLRGILRWRGSRGRFHHTTEAAVPAGSSPAPDNGGEMEGSPVPSPEATSAEKQRFGLPWLFVGSWLILALGVASMLPRLAPVFRVRYGIITLLPLFILLAPALDRALGLIRQNHQPAMRILGGMILLAGGVQIVVNVHRSIYYRMDLGGVMKAVDRAYAYIDSHPLPDKQNAVLAFLPGFQPYAYRPGASGIFQRRRSLPTVASLVSLPPGRAYVLSWTPVEFSALELAGRFPGWDPVIPFDQLFPSPWVAYLYRDVRLAVSPAAGK